MLLQNSSCQQCQTTRLIKEWLKDLKADVHSSDRIYLNYYEDPMMSQVEQLHGVICLLAIFIRSNLASMHDSWRKLRAVLTQKPITQLNILLLGYIKLSGPSAFKEIVLLWYQYLVEKQILLSDQLQAHLFQSIYVLSVTLLKCWASLQSYIVVLLIVFPTFTPWTVGRSTLRIWQ